MEVRDEVDQAAQDDQVQNVVVGPEIPDGLLNDANITKRERITRYLAFVGENDGPAYRVSIAFEDRAF